MALKQPKEDARRMLESVNKECCAVYYEFGYEDAEQVFHERCMTLFGINRHEVVEYVKEIKA